MKGRKNKEPCTLHGSDDTAIKLSVFSFFHCDHFAPVVRPAVRTNLVSGLVLTALVAQHQMPRSQVIV